MGCYEETFGSLKLNRRKVMRIAHVGVAGPFTENMSYQDNILSHQNALDGHEVLYISNEYFFTKFLQNSSQFFKSNFGNNFTN